VFGDCAARACADALAPAEARGLVERFGGAVGERGEAGGTLHGSVRLSAPEGFLVSNDLISDVFVVLSDCELPESAAVGLAGAASAA
jgi:hypothetical protein